MDKSLDDIWRRLGNLEALERIWAENQKESRLHAANEEGVFRTLLKDHAGLRSDVDMIKNQLTKMNEKLDTAMGIISHAKGAKSMLSIIITFGLGVLTAVGGFFAGRAS